MLRMPTFRLAFVILVWIEIIVLPVTVLGQLQNVALKKNAFKSSKYPFDTNAVASRAVDGNTEQAFAGSSCFVTNNEPSPYWKVDLGYRYRIDHIKIYNVKDPCCGHRSSNVRTDISVDGTNYTQVCFHAGQIPDIYTCRPDTVVEGRWVKITITTPEYEPMNLCEVEVLVEKGMFTSTASVKGTGSVLQTRNVASDTVCAYHCSRNTNCMAVNVINISTGIECQLLGSEDSAQTNEANISFWKIFG